MSEGLEKAGASLPSEVMKDRVVKILVGASELLKEAKTVQQAKLIADVASAQKVYAKRQQLGEEVIGYAHALKVEALARLGELLEMMPKNEGAKGTGSNQHEVRLPTGTAPPTYAELGIGKKEAMVAQRLAALPADTRAAIARQEISLTEANRQQRREQQPQDRILPPGKFRVLYADPPWSYGNSGVIGQTDNYGRAERHYPAMTIAELCDMDVKSRAADDAVLFLWVTSPLLDECWPVIKAWGFEYKTSMVWDKVKHNYGSYVSVRHELLLICTRGSCLPDHPTPMPDSVISLERSDTHSQKPEAFRSVIDKLYSGGADQKLELFGRGKVAGWTVFGNELAVVS